MAPLDAADIIILIALALVAGPVVGLMLGVPVGLVIRPRRRYRTRSTPMETFSAASMQIDPLDIARAHNDDNLPQLERSVPDTNANPDRNERCGRKCVVTFCHHDSSASCSPAGKANQQKVRAGPSARLAENKTSVAVRRSNTNAHPLLTPLRLLLSRIAITK